MIRERKERNSLARIILSDKGLFGEFMLGAFALLWGVWLLLPMDSFLASAMYYSLGKMLPETTWGILMIGLGALQLNPIFLNSLTGRRFASVVAVVIWSFIGSLFAFDSPSNPGVASYFLIAVYNAINYVRITWSKF